MDSFGYLIPKSGPRWTATPRTCCPSTWRFRVRQPGALCPPTWSLACPSTPNGGVIVASVIGLVATVITAFLATVQFLTIRRLRNGQDGPPSLEARLQTLASSLASAGRAAAAVEAEIRARELAVEDLRARSEQYEELARLSEQEARAVEAALDRVVQRDRSRAFWLNTLVGFGLGVGTSLLANAIWVGVLHR